MNYLECLQFQEGGPAPATWYADCLRQAYREVCLLGRQRRVFKRVELEPLWHFVETMAVARLFGVSRHLYDRIDKQISRMGRGLLIKLALQCFLTPALADYLRALKSGQVSPSDAVALYLRLRAALDWMEDNIFIEDQAVDGVDELMLRFREVVQQNRDLLVEQAIRYPEIDALWCVMIRRADSRFVTADYVTLS